MALGGLAAPAVAQDRKVKFTFEEINCGKLTAGTRPEQIVFSADGQHIALPQKQPDGWVVLHNGQPTAKYPWIMGNTLALSPKGGRLAFAVQDGEELYVVADGKPQARYAEVGIPIFSAEGARLAYTARKADGKMMVVVDGRPEAGEYSKITPASLTFSRDGKRLAYMVEPAPGKSAWVVDGKVEATFDFVTPLEFSRDGSRYAYGGARGGRFVAVVDGREGTAIYEKVGGFEFSPDSRRLAYMVARGRKMLMVADGQEHPEHDLVSQPRFSSDSAKLAYIVRNGNLGRVILNGEPQQGYELVFEALFSADGQHLACHVADGGKQMVVLDGRESKPYDRIGTMALSEKGERLAFAARDGDRDVLVIDGREYQGVGNLTLSPGDGRFVAHMLDRLNKSVLMVNGQEGATYDGFLYRSRFAFDGPNTLYVMAARQQEILRVKVTLDFE